MNDWDPYDDDDDDEEVVIIKPPIPEPYVTAHLHGGPFDGETLQLPWARVEMSVLGWLGDLEMVESLYQLVPLWRGQDTAHYAYVEPKPPAAPAKRPICLTIGARGLTLTLEWRR